MDPSLDPQPLAAQTAAAIPAIAAATTAAAPAVAAPVQLPVSNHPPYAEMISAAITALNEREGSSKRAIAKYIETHYSDLTPTHSALLTHHLKRLKSIGQLLMVKHSYTLPGLRSAPPAVNGTVAVESADPASTAVKRRPGRPPKPKPDAVQVAVPVFPPPINMNDVPILPPENIAPLSENAHIAAAPVNGAATATATAPPVRGRGRPPKQSVVKRGRGRPPKSGGGGSVGGVGSGSGRGRPKKYPAPGAAPAAAPAAAVRSGRPRGRPPKPINVVEGPINAVGGLAPLSDGNAAAPVVAPPVASPVTGKRRGRPRKVENVAKKPRQTNSVFPGSGKPRGRPRKAVNQTQTQDSSQLLVAYLDLKAKLENLQSMVKHTATLIRPSLNSEAAINAVQELELVAMNVSAPPIVQPQQQPVPEQAQPQN